MRNIKGIVRPHKLTSTVLVSLVMATSSVLQVARKESSDDSSAAAEEGLNVTYINQVLRQASQRHPPATEATAWLLVRSRSSCSTIAGASQLRNLSSIQICRNATHGLMVAKFVDDAERSLVMRINGGTVQTRLFSRAPIGSQSSRRMWIAPFRFCRPGNYTFHMLLVFRMAQKENACALQHTQAGVLLKGHVIEHLISAPDQQEVDACFTSQWHWAHVMDLKDRRPNMKKRCLGGCMNPSLNTIDLRQPLNNFRGPRLYNKASPTQLFYGDGKINTPSSWWSSGTEALPLCFVGDSTMRSLVNQIIATRPRVHGEPLCDPAAKQRERKACSASNITFVPDTRGDGAINAMNCILNENETDRYLSRCNPDLQACRTLIINFGTWCASFKAVEIAPPGLGGPMDLDRYGAKVSHVTRLMGLLKLRRGIRTGFLATQPHPLHDGTCSKDGKTRYRPSERWNTDRTEHRCNTHPKWPYYSAIDCPKIGDWRFPHVLAAYNRIAQSLAEREGVEYVDTWQPQLDLIETASDGAHYTEPPIAPVLAHLVWKWAASGPS